MKVTSALIKIFLVGVSCLLLSACAPRLKGLNPFVSDSESAQTGSGQWLKAGTLVIARAVPQEVVTSPSTLMGFMPQKIAPTTKGHSLTIDRGTRRGVLYHGSVKLEEFELKDIDGLNPGIYTVIHKQRHPVWYASDEYYINRGLAIPDSEDRSRYLKGALGDFVIYLDEQTPIHNAQVWSDDVGGVRIGDNNIAKMYYQLEIGARVTVQ